MFISSLYTVIVWEKEDLQNVVFIDRRFNNLGESHHQSYVKRWLPVYGVLCKTLEYSTVQKQCKGSKRQPSSCIATIQQQKLVLKNRLTSSRKTLLLFDTHLINTGKQHPQQYIHWP